MHLFLYSQALPVITLLIVSSSRLQPPQNTKKTQDVVVIPYSLKHAIILKVLKKQIYKHAHRKRREVIEVIGYWSKKDDSEGVLQMQIFSC